MLYELREYVAHDHALDAVHDRFAKTTLPLFERHGLAVEGFWTDKDASNRILYLLRFESEDAQERAWQSFQDDEEWKAAKAASEAHGPIVDKMISRSLDPVSYWPPETSHDDGIERR